MTTEPAADGAHSACVAEWPLLPTETEIYILPDGRVVIADLPAELAPLTAALGAVEASEIAPMPSLIPLFDERPNSAAGAGPRILQLYQDLELFSDGEPPANALFVLGRSLGYAPDQAGLWRDQLLIVDPPPDLHARFRLEGDVAALFTEPRPDADAVAAELARVQTMAGGVAHIRLGEHFLDIYAEQAGAVVHLPALGILLGGVYGSDVVPPRLGPNANGEEALDTLRLIARILKRHHFQLYIPRIGSLVENKLTVMERLAADVAYIHSLRRLIGPLAQSGEPWEAVEAVGASLLPAAMQTPAAQAVHTANLHSLYGAVGNTQSS